VRLQRFLSRKLSDSVCDFFVKVFSFCDHVIEDNPLLRYFVSDTVFYALFFEMVCT